jgi:hypothetical protein
MPPKKKDGAKKKKGVRCVGEEGSTQTPACTSLVQAGNPTSMPYTCTALLAFPQTQACMDV